MIKDIFLWWKTDESLESVGIECTGDPKERYLPVEVKWIIIKMEYY